MELALAENVDWTSTATLPLPANFQRRSRRMAPRKLVPEQLQHELEHRQVHSTQRKRTPWDQEKNRSFTLSNFGSNFRKFLKSHLGEDYKPKIASMGQKMLITIE